MTVYAFGPFRLDDRARALTRDGEDVDLQPKAFDLLVHLVRNRRRVLVKDELLKAVWTDVAVGESSLRFAVKGIRKALGDTDQAIVRTIHGRGFRFVAVCTEGGAPDLGTTSTTPTTARGDGSGRAGASPFFACTTPLVGRTAELETLSHLLEESLAGRGSMVVVSGDAGIGKTRLASELSSMAAQRGATTLLGSCDENSPPAFWPWLPVLRRMLECVPARSLAGLSAEERTELARLVPALAVQADIADAPRIDANVAALSGPTGAAATAAWEGERLHEALANAVTQAADDVPLVVVFDDVQWADAASLHALRLLAGRVGAHPLLLVVLYREGEAGAEHPLTAFLAETQGDCTTIRLEGLAQSESTRLLQHIAATVPDAELAAAIARVTEGNPFFVEEMVHHLAEEGGVASADAVLRSGGTVVAVRDILDRRLSRLTPGCVDVLTVAAVAGREFSFDVVCTAAGLHGEDGAAAVEEAIAARILQEGAADPARFRFRHALIREALYTRTAALRRSELHRQVGEAAEVALSPGAEGRAEELAHHFSQSGSCPDKSIFYSLEAGGHAVARLAYQDAAQRFEHAAALLDEFFPTELERAYEARLRAGEAFQSAGDGRRSRTAYHRAADVARTLGDAHRLVLAATADRSRRPFSGFESRDLHEEACAIVLESPDLVPPGLAARALSRLAATIYNLPGSLQRREDLARRALALTGDGADPDSRIVVLDNVALALWRPEHAEWRIALAEEQERLAAGRGAAAARLGAAVWAISARLESGQVRAALAAIERFVPDAAASRLPAFLADITMFQAMRAFMDCRFEEAEVLVAEALSRGHESDEVAPAIRFGALMMALRGEQGRAGEILPLLHVLESQMPDLPWAFSFADLYAQTGDCGRAGEYFDKAVGDNFAALRAMEGHSLWLPSIFIVARACVALGRASEAAPLYERLLPHAASWAVIGQGTVCLGSIEHALGLLAACSGRAALAISHLEIALVRHESEGARLPTFRSAFELARLLLGHGDAAQRERGAALLAQTELAAAAAGHAWLRQQIEETRAKRDGGVR